MPALSRSDLAVSVLDRRGSWGGWALWFSAQVASVNDVDRRSLPEGSSGWCGPKTTTLCAAGRRLSATTSWATCRR